jgi:hypothetical protein
MPCSDGIYTKSNIIYYILCYELRFCDQYFFFKIIFDYDFIIKLGSKLYFLLNRSIHLSNILVGTTISPAVPELLENDAIY